MLAASVSQMSKDLAQQQAESDLGEQFAEFTEHLHKGVCVCVCEREKHMCGVHRALIVQHKVYSIAALQ